MKQLFAKYSTLFSVALLVALVAWICYTSLLAYWVGDDLDYMFCVNDSIWNSSGKIESAYDLFASMYHHYIYVNGRYVAHFLVQIYCGVLGQTAFAVSNALVWLVFVVLIAKMAGVDWRSPKVMLGIILVSLLAFVTKMMPTCQIGFVWMMTLSMLWILILRKLSGRKIRFWLLPILFIFSILAGNGQEALNIGIAVAVIFYCCVKRFRLSRVEWTMFAGFAVGLGFLCFTPAVSDRMGGISLSWQRSMLNMALCLPVFWAMCLLLIYKTARRRLSIKGVWHKNRYSLLAIAVLLLLNVYIGVYCNRQLFGIELLSLFVILRTVRQGRINAVWLSALALLTVAMMVCQDVWLKDSRRQFEQMEEAYVKSTDGKVYYDRHRSTTSYFGLMAHYHETAIGYADADIAHSFGKYMKSKYPDRGFGVQRPKRLESGIKLSELNFVEQYYPGHYYALTDDKTDHSVVITEELNLPYVSIGRRERIEPLEFNYTKRANFHTYLIVPQDPLYRIVDVKLIK